MPQVAFPLSAVLLGMGVLLLGNGLFGTLTALRMIHEGFAATTIGVVIACHSIGFAAACLTSRRIIDAVGHIRTFAAFAALLAVCSLAFSVFPDPLAWVALRLIFGYSSAAVFMVGESWLAGAATTDSRGKVFAIYMVVNKAGFGLGQLLLILGDPTSDRLFMLTATLFALCLVPIALARTEGPKGLGRGRLGIKALYRLSPVGVAGAVAAGAANSSLLGLGPVFASGQGLSVPQVSGFMVAFLTGSLAMQIPIGRLSDRFDRRRVLLGVVLSSAAAAAATAVVAPTTFYILIMFSALVGGLSATVYPLAMTHATDFASSEQTVSVHAGLLLSFATGASTGPILASLAMEYMGPPGLFAFAAAVNLVLAGFTLYRMTRRAPVPEEQQQDFVAMPQTSHTSPAVGNLHPQIEGDGDAEKAVS
jgi:MFS family permease